MNDINSTSIQHSIDKLNRKDGFTRESRDLLKKTIERKGEEIRHLMELVNKEEWKLAQSNVIRTTLKSYDKKLLSSPIDGLPVSLDGCSTWCMVTSQGIDEHGNITVSDGDSTRSVAIKEVVVAPIVISRYEELCQAPIGTTVFNGVDTFKKVDDDTWLRNTETTMDKDEHIDGSAETSKLSTWDMFDMIWSRFILRVKTWGKTSMERWG